jgi:myo-inositol-1-phosphate synthase
VADQIAVVIRFTGDPDELLGRFEQARQAWIDAQEADYEGPLFYAACRTDEGIAIVNAWPSAQSHRAFGQGLHPHITAAGLDHPERIERLRIDKLGWD